jgi:hypothetical protein
LLPMSVSTTINSLNFHHLFSELRLRTTNIVEENIS